MYYLCIRGHTPIQKQSTMTSIAKNPNDFGSKYKSKETDILAENYTISTQILLPVIEQLRERGFRARPLLDNLSIDPKLFEAAAEVTSQPHLASKQAKK